MEKRKIQISRTGGDDLKAGTLIDKFRRREKGRERARESKNRGRNEYEKAKTKEGITLRRSLAKNTIVASVERVFSSRQSSR